MMRSCVGGLRSDRERKDKRNAGSEKNACDDQKNCAHEQISVGVEGGGLTKGDWWGRWIEIGNTTEEGTGVIKWQRLRAQ